MKLAGVNLSGMPLLPVFAAVAAGETFAWLFTGMSLYGAAFCTALCIFCMLLRRYFFAIMAAMVAIGVVAVWCALPEPAVFIGEKAVIVGKVSEVRHNPFSQRIVVSGAIAKTYEADGMSLGSPVGNVLVCFNSPEPPVEVGDEIAVSGVLSNPFDKVAVPGEFTMEAFVHRRAITSRIEVSAGRLGIMREASGFPVVMRRTRRGISETIFSSGVSRTTASMLEAVLMGDDEELGADMREAFSRAGIAHVLALSGTHVAVIAMFVSALFFPFAMAGRRRLVGVCTILCLWAYVVLTGGSPSVVRAVVMATIVLLSRMLERMSNPFNSLCCAGLLIALFDPLAIVAPGFQLSFLAVAGILLFAPELTFGKGWVRRLSQWFAVCIGAVAGTAPLSAWLFHVFPLYFLLSNAVVAIILPVFMVAGILLLVLHAAGLPVSFLEWLCDSAGGVIGRVSAGISAIPGSCADGIYFSAWVLPFWYVSILAGWIALKRRKASFAIAFAMLLLFSCVMTGVTKPKHPHVECYELDRPYWREILVRNGNRAVVLTDAKPYRWAEIKAGEEWRLRDYLSERDIDSLEVRKIPESFDEIWGGKVALSQNRSVISHKVDVDSDSIGR